MVLPGAARSAAPSPSHYLKYLPGLGTRLQGPRRADCELAAQRPYPPIPSAKILVGAHCALCMVMEEGVVA